MRTDIYRCRVSVLQRPLSFRFVRDEVTDDYRSKCVPVLESIYGVFLERVTSITALVYLKMKTKYSNRKMGYASALVIPFITIAAIYIFFKFLRNRQPGDISIEVFILTGIVELLLFTYTMAIFINLMRQPRDNMTIHPVVNSFDVCISTMVVELSPLVIVATSIVLALYILGFDIYIDNLPLLLICLLGAVLFGVGVGSIIGIFALYAEVVLSFRTAVNRLLFLLSGIFFSIDELPPRLYEFVKYIPLAHTIEGLRLSMYRSYPDKLMSLSLAFEIITVILLVAVVLSSTLRRHKEN